MLNLFLQSYFPNYALLSLIENSLAFLCSYIKFLLENCLDLADDKIFFIENFNAAFFFFFKPWYILYILFFYFYFCVCWVFVSVRGLSLVAARGGHSSSRCAGFSLSRPLLLLSTGSRRAGSVVVAHGPSCSAACGIFPDQGSNPCPLHWQADSQPLRHQGSPNAAL